jgi:hypothetical protein
MHCNTDYTRSPRLVFAVGDQPDISGSHIITARTSMNQQEAARQLGRFLSQARKGFNAGGGAPGSGGKPPNLSTLLGGSGVVLALVGGAIVLNSSLYNVDGGHRAIKSVPQRARQFAISCRWQVHPIARREERGLLGRYPLQGDLFLPASGRR